MKKSLLSLIGSGLLLTTLHAQDVTINNGWAIQDSVVKANTPKWVEPILEKSEIAAKHKILPAPNPYYFEADFTGDKSIDIAFFVENTVDHTKGVMIINNDKKLVYIIGCGSPTEMGSSLGNFPSWMIYREKTIRNQGKKTVAIKAPAIVLKGSKETNLAIYWSRTKYKTFIQQ